MKSILWLAAACLGLVATVQAEITSDDRARAEKLSRLPISVYPDYDVRGSMLVSFLNEAARPGDAVVVSHLDALKVSARIAEWNLATAEVWVHVAGEVSIRDTHRRNFEGAKGLVLVPPAVGRAGFRMLKAVTERLGGDARQAGMRFVVGLEEDDLRLRANAEEMAHAADIVTIYLPRKLRAGPKEFRSLFSRVVADARKANPAVQIELALPTGNTLDATRYVAGLAFANADLIDRLAFYCEDSAASLESLRTLFAVLRPGGVAARAQAE